jgi:hypothetical protein
VRKIAVPIHRAPGAVRVRRLQLEPAAGFKGCVRRIKTVQHLGLVQMLDDVDPGDEMATSIMAASLASGSQPRK